MYEHSGGNSGYQVQGGPSCLPISGSNVVLRVQWLKSLGPILTDYNTLRMQFFCEGRLVELKGDNDANLRQLSSLLFHRLCHRQGDRFCFQITMLSNDTTSLDTSGFPPEIQTLLLKFDTLFQQPQSLPPARSIDHHIHLLS